METRSRKQQGKSKSVFVTVGTTKFDKLIETVCSASTLKCLQMLGYQEVLLQIGAGEFEPGKSEVQGISVDYYKFKPSIKGDIESADLVISHAGAGSCLETLGAGKKLLVVINDELMGNHQLELAYQLHKDQHLYYCTCRNLVETLETADFNKLVPFKPGKPEIFAQFLDKMMGFT
ncbi:UDP-N-acetylglucosamine transferase subunit ALG13 homolog [Mercenaria mercenaria]|uniref:UDP-N-acetylglucosamine transferase subunit ALG13 homolog n=1 Tax=Mercenaria mercenaria TaxID=6596 RepID=UPI00234E974C|nr:UDP-N-acetylglucosamine transferase subunit ALG13 homolog [Mercenaria mercenaria]XP_045168753.2 UDP-N-acetylglucosamine transferase subunit ALG13 homolog [Mercenaria mercenaria]